MRLSGGMRELPSVKLAELPRMADFAAFAEAVGRGAGMGSGDRRSRTTTRIARTRLRRRSKTRSLATAMLETRPQVGIELVRECDGAARGTRRTRWQESDFLGRVAQIARAFMNELRRIAPQLRSHGLFVTFERTDQKRLIIVRNTAWHKMVGQA